MMDSKISCNICSLLLLLLLSTVHRDVVSATDIDYRSALTKSLLYFEAQRSGKLPADQRVSWRGDSALRDGADEGVDLVGGYYDSGDNVKFGFPMAFTITTLSWSVVEFGRKLASSDELENALAAVRWGTDYMLKSSNITGEGDVVFYAQVGDADSDHACWQRPEDMTTPRTSYEIDSSLPGSDLAGETAAALAAASLAFRNADPTYSDQLLDHAETLFKFGCRSMGLYSNSIPAVQQFYSSSGYHDELQWAAVWLHRATSDEAYLDYVETSGNTGGVRSLFSWDDKFLGVQILVSKLVLEGRVGSDGVWAEYKKQGEDFLCNFIQKGSNKVVMSPGGMAWWNQPWNHLQYTTASLLALLSYSDYLQAADTIIACPIGTATPDQIISFAYSQVDYILGANPEKMSYMVGFGDKYPTRVHHRGASIVSVKNSATQVDCQAGFNLWFYKDAPNPNVLHGAIVGGPDGNDAYSDSRSNFQQAEPATVTTAPFVGVLARLA